MDIRVRYTAIDGCRQSRRYKTLEGARRYARKWVGETPEISETFGYAVSWDGVGKVTVEGCSIHDLFPERLV